MWMRGYNDGADFSSIQDSFTGRKLRPLMPRPTVVNPTGLARISGCDLLTLNQHLATAAEHNKLSSTQQVVVSSRWNPTPEQLQTLEELYRRGTRTPSAEQIQHITAQLRRYGKIEGKNVFYWFQNHKARERQKRRRQLKSPSDEQSLHGDKKESSPGANRRAIEVEQTKNWASPTNSRTIAEKSVSTQGAASAKGAGEAESKGADGWLQFDEDASESQQGSNPTWQMAHLSYSPSPTTPINSLSAAAASTTDVQSTPAAMETDLVIQTHDFIDVFAETVRHSAGDGGTGVGAGGTTVAQTLQLFPLQNDKAEENNEDEAGVGAMGVANDDVTAYQFFEFLPLKN